MWDYNPEDEVLLAVGVSEAVDSSSLRETRCFITNRAMCLISPGAPWINLLSQMKVLLLLLQKHGSLDARFLMLNFPTNPPGTASPEASGHQAICM